MMSCAQVRPLLSFFLEKETGPFETLETRRHLDGCDSCSSRARHISRVMDTCARLPESEPAVDVAPAVMSRLRSLRAKLTLPQAAKWSSLALLLAAGAATLSRPGALLLTALGRPIAFLAAILAGGDATDGAGALAGRAVPIALRMAGGAFKPEIYGGAGSDLGIAIQILATSLAIGFTIAIPVAVMTAWFLHAESGRRDSPHV